MPRTKNKVNFFTGLMLVVLPKCPFCVMAFSSTFVLCGKAGSFTTTHTYSSATAFLLFVGVDINVKSPDEVAISILAELIQVKNNLPSVVSLERFGEANAKTEALPKYYINQVCGMAVDRNNPKYIIEYKGEKIYFCCDGCKVKFEADPEKYMIKAKAN